MNGIKMEDKLNIRFAELIELSKQLSKHQSEWDYLENWKHSQRSILMKQAEIAGFKTAASQEREALANDEYIMTLKAIRIATEETLRIKWQLSISQMRFEAWRSLQATTRAEMNIK